MALRSGSGGAAPEPREGLSAAWVRDALLRLHDPVALRRHGLARLLAEAAGGRLADAAELRRRLLEGIEHLQPPPRTPAGDRAWRPYQLLRARYVEGLDTTAAQRRLGLAKSQYHAEHGRAVEALTEALRQRWPRPSSAADAPIRGTNLVPALTSFVGRERELSEVHALLRDVRLLTLTGTGGCGKTRLAYRVGELAAGDYAGVWVVELAALATGEQVTREVAAVLGVQERPDETLAVTLARVLGSERVLLILDNCEHQLEACARLAEQLLVRCPVLSILATSREALDAAGESTWRVPSLPVPRAAPSRPDSVQLAELAIWDAVRLFVERARAARNDFELTEENAAAVAQICRLLDGIPLAIELAAARTGGLTPGQIAARLDRRFELLTRGGRTALPRHRTLRALAEWSYELLTEPERALFDQLAVFAGGFALEAVEAVCGTDGAPVVDTLLRLVEKSLVVAEGGDGTGGGARRYRLLETLRQFAEDKLAARREIGFWRARHAAYFAALVARELPEVQPLGQAAFFDRLELELDNVRALQRWVLEAGDAATGLRLPGQLRLFWYDRGYMSEARAWTAALLTLPNSAAPSAQRAQALYVAGYLAWQQGDLAAARDHLLESLASSRQVGARAGAALASEYLGRAHLDAGDLSEARTWLEEARAHWKAQGRPDDAAVLTLGHVARFSGRYAEARVLYEQCLASFRARDAGWLMAITLGHLGAAALEERDLGTARARTVESLTLSQELGFQGHVPEALEVAAGIAAAVGENEDALRMAGAAEALRQRANTTRSPVEEVALARWLHPASSAISAQEQSNARAEGEAMSLEQAVGHALERLIHAGT